MKFAPHILGAALCSAPLASAFFAPSTLTRHVPPLPKTARAPSPSSSTRLHSSTSPSSSSINNVVLSPSTSDPAAFDSYAIGTPRVHRYLRDSNDSDEAEYVMWYHGRCTNLNDPKNNLPPLSTGRIGRATSRNGLVWTKCEVGSGSEANSPPGVSLGLNEESWWNFDTSHVGKYRQEMKECRVNSTIMCGGGGFAGCCNSIRMVCTTFTQKCFIFSILPSQPFRQVWDRSCSPCRRPRCWPREECI